MNKMLNDEYYMRQALYEAQLAFDKGEVPVGAVITCQGRIITRAHNLIETLCDVTAHAEMLAITAASSFLGSKYLIDCTLYVTIEPCSMCAAASGWAQLSRIVFAARDEKKGYHIFSPAVLHPKTEVFEGILSAEAAQLMKTFFENQRTK